jgi:signal transduction histidine kinase
MMGRNSLRWRLPFSYALIALITAAALAGMLLLALHSYYQEQERRYLLGNARTISIAMQLAEKYQAPAKAVQAQVETFSFITQTRVQLLDAQRNTVADSGLPFHQALTLRYDEQGNGDGPVWLLGAIFGGISNTEPAPEQKTVLSFPAAGSLYGFDLDQSAAPPARRSAQRLTVPIADEQGAVLGYVELSEGPAYGWDIILSVAWGLLIAASAAIVLAGAVGWLISRRISAPVVALAQTTLRMTSGDLSTRAEVDRRDEIGVLAHAFNEMAARIEATISTLRSFVSDAAHELHTPLTALRTDLELAADDPDPVQRAAHLDRALEQMRRLEGLTANLLNLSRLEAGIHEEHRPIDVSQLVAGLSEVYASRAEQAGSTLQFELPDAPMIVQGYEMSLRQAVGNLLDNAIKFTPPGGQVQLSLYQDDGRVVILVKDSGIGIPAEDLPHLFRRFHRGRNAAAYPGSGLGLAITHSIIQAHAGTIEVRSSGAGSCFRILLE